MGAQRKVVLNHNKEHQYNYPQKLKLFLNEVNGHDDFAALNDNQALEFGRKHGCDVIVMKREIIIKKERANFYLEVRK